MVSIGSADVGAGSQVKLITTNYLVCSAGAVTTSTVKDFDGAKNLLTLVQNHFNDSPIRPDYILMGGTLGDAAAAAFTTAGTASSTVLNGGNGLSTVNVVSSSGYSGAVTVTITGGGGSGATATGTLSGSAVNAVTITNPGTGYTSQPTISVTGGGGGTNAVCRIDGAFQELTAPVSGDATATNQASEVLGVVSIGAVELTTNGFGASTPLSFTVAQINLASTAATIENSLNGTLMVDSADSYPHKINLTEAIRDVEDAIGNSIDLTQANLDASFVAPGNAAGTTATTLADVLTASQNQLAILSVTTIAK